ncbi:MAG: hypothetical protein HQL69_13815 [Magnetococcales bacterium]|nr:hypothetical protein [Magnetococcales bacterium]
MNNQVELDEKLLDRLAVKLADKLDDDIRYTKKHREVNSSHFSVVFKVISFLLIFTFPWVGLPLFVYAIASDSSWYCGNCHADTSRFSKFCKNCFCEYT